MIRDAVLRVRDEGTWDRALKREVEDLEELENMVQQLQGEDNDE